MTAHDTVKHLLSGQPARPGTSGDAYASANIALCKYWGKRDPELNLPVTSSLSVSMGPKGTACRIRPAEKGDGLSINGERQPDNARATRRLSRFLDLFRSSACPFFDVESTNTLPMAAGLASSASAFPSTVLALKNLFGWNLGVPELSILARMGSGSACRSIEAGFVIWQAGERDDGLDSFAERMPCTWPELAVGLLTLSSAAKPIGSRDAMNRTTATSVLYRAWPEQVRRDMQDLRAAIEKRDLRALGEVAENNALAMHATMAASRPAILYWLPETVAALHTIWKLREEGLPLYFTMDAGPNVKLLFERGQEASVRKAFPDVETVYPFGEPA